MSARSTALPSGDSAPGVSRWASPFVWCTVTAGAVVIALNLVDVVATGNWADLVPFLILAVVAERLSVDTYSDSQARISLSFGIAVAMAAAVALPHGAALVAIPIALTTAVIQRHDRIEKTLFNLANYALATTLGALLYLLVHAPGEGLELRTILASLVAVVGFHIVNTGMVAIVVSLHSTQPLVAVVRSSTWHTPNTLALGLIGGCVALVHTQLGPLGMLLFTLPLGVLRYTLTMYTRQTRRTIQALERQARHDHLTGLPNRLLLREGLEAILRNNEEGVTGAGESGQLLLLDLDHFKEVNDTFGHYAGDRLLEQVAHRLRDNVPGNALVARLGGDEFAVVVMTSAMSPEAAEAIPRDLLALVDRPVAVEGQRLNVAASIGVVHFPADGKDAESLLRRADVAMYVAKRAHSGYANYDAAQDQHTPERLGLVGELREAIEQNELTLAYQPQIAVDTNQVTGVEALVRWTHPRRGMIPPIEFIAIAEQTGLIEPLTRCVLRTALRQCRVWLDKGVCLPISVNVSATDLQDGFAQVVEELLETHRVSADYLRLEITEGAMMVDRDRASRVLQDLRSLGVQISIDDYGTGYSSLAYLGLLPIDELKIDRSFIAGLLSSTATAAIVRSTIALGHDLGLVVVAEGVEDQPTWDVLVELGCDTIQGYFASRPLSADALESWMLARSPAPFRPAHSPLRRVA
jgi:diguanylate cyclase (GGDEF)-like protein